MIESNWFLWRFYELIPIKINFFRIKNWIKRRFLKVLTLETDKFCSLRRVWAKRQKKINFHEGKMRKCPDFSREMRKGGGKSFLCKFFFLFHIMKNYVMGMGVIFGTVNLQLSSLFLMKFPFNCSRMAVNM